MLRYTVRRVVAEIYHIFGNTEDEALADIGYYYPDEYEEIEQPTVLKVEEEEVAEDVVE